MTPQYIYNNIGKAVGVFLSIEDWNSIVKEYPEVGSKGMENDEIIIPEWQIEFGKKELENIEDSTKLVDWNVGKKQLKL